MPRHVVIMFFVHLVGLNQWCGRTVHAPSVNRGVGQCIQYCCLALENQPKRCRLYLRNLHNLKCKPNCIFMFKLFSMHILCLFFTRNMYTYPSCMCCSNPQRKHVQAEILGEVYFCKICNIKRSFIFVTALACVDIGLSSEIPSHFLSDNFSKAKQNPRDIH